MLKVWMARLTRRKYTTFNKIILRQHQWLNDQIISLISFSQLKVFYTANHDFGLRGLYNLKPILFFFVINLQSWAPQAQVLGSRYFKDYILSSWFLLELWAQNLVLDLKYTKWTWSLFLSYTNLANSLIFLSKPSVFS